MYVCMYVCMKALAVEPINIIKYKPLLEAAGRK